MLTFTYILIIALFLYEQTGGHPTATPVFPFFPSPPPPSSPPRISKNTLFFSFFSPPPPPPPPGNPRRSSVISSPSPSVAMFCN
ncbi:hypothetical protein Hanom_Chr12g01081121 [Helianthus anomalus]